MRPPRNQAANRAVEFISNLTLVGDYSGQQWQWMPHTERVIRTLFGTMDRDKRRAINRAFLFIPRKQQKTTLASAIVIYWLLGMGKVGQQVLSLANDRTQAAIIFDTARQMIEADEYLRSLVEIVPSTKRITVPGKHSFYAALSTESTTKTGFNPSLVLIDEFQDITDADLIKNITTGFGAREDYLTLFIATAGTKKNTPCFAEYEYAKAVQSGSITNEHYAAFIHEAPEAADWTSEATWAATMPAYKHIPSLRKFIRSEYDLAQRLPHKQREFRQYYLNQWQIGDGTKWLADSDWMANADEPLNDAEFYTAGLDLASVQDTSSLVLFGRNSEGKYEVIPTIWVCEAQIEKRKTADFDYRKWADDGWMRVTPGNAQDQEFILADLMDIFRRYNIRQLAIDRFGTHWFGPQLSSRGIPAYEFGQGTISMSEPLKQLEKLTLNRSLAHGGNPVLRWMCSNTRLVTDRSENYRITKDNREAKVDGMVALAMAIGVYPFSDAASAVYDYDFLMSLLKPAVAN